MPVLKAGVFREDSIAVVNRVAFADGVKGYLISCVDSNKISNEIFKYEAYYDRVALVSLNGRILAGAEVGTDFFENEIDMGDIVSFTGSEQQMERLDKVQFDLITGVKKRIIGL